MALRKGPSKPNPRPDAQNLEAPLPLWVDCHLSWMYDRGRIKKISPKLVLRSTSNTCVGQLENYATNPQPKVR